MPKVKIDVDELYPYFELSEHFGEEIDMTTEDHHRLMKLQRQFVSVQEELRSIHEAAVVIRRAKQAK